MEAYLNYLHHIKRHGVTKEDRTGTGTTSVFGYQMRFNLQDGFPLVTTKKVSLKSIITELLWFLRGDTNVRWLQERGCTIWDEWARPDGDLGPVYGKQWRFWQKVTRTSSGAHFATVDQISEAVRLLQTDPDSRRILVSAWNVADLPKMALLPCHVMFQFYTEELTLSARYKLGQLSRQDLYTADKVSVSPLHDMLDGLGVPRRKLSCQLYQRSADSFLGVPYNIASYALLTHMMAQQCGMDVGDFIWTGGDCHIYSNHQQQVETQLARTPYALPKLTFARKPASLFDYQPEDFVLYGYQHHPAISAPVAV